MDFSYSNEKPDRLLNPKPKRGERIRYLVGRKFPMLAFANHPKMAEAIDVEAVKAFQASLEEMADSELEQLCHDEYRAEAEANDKALFFNKLDAAANFEYWAKQRYWSTDQGIALILGKDPRRVSWENIRSMVLMHWFAAKYAELRDLVSGHSLAGGQLAGGVVPPSVFLRWAERYDLPVPEYLKTAVEKYAGNLRDWQDAYNEKAAEVEVLNKTMAQAMQMMKQAEEIMEAQKRRIADMEAQIDRNKVERDSLQEAVLQLGMQLDRKRDNGDVKAASLTVPSPQPRHRAQEGAILEWLTLNEYDPQNIPKPEPGRAGAKADAKRSLVQLRADIFQSPGTFDKAWQRLRDADEIKDEE